MGMVYQKQTLYSETIPSCLTGEEVNVSSHKTIRLENRDYVYLVYSQKGVFSATIGTQSLIIHPAHVMVLPARSICRLNSNNGVVQIVSIHRSQCVHEKSLRVFLASDITRALMAEIVQLQYKQQSSTRQAAILSLLLSEMRQKMSETNKLSIEMPTDERLLCVCRDLLRSPSLSGNMDVWCRKAGMSRRNFTRMFKSETGMTFIEWRREVRLLMALSNIAIGEKITSAAYQVGYENVSTFTAAFSRRFGMPPGRYKPKSGQMVSYM